MCTCAVDAQHLTLAQQIALFGAAGPPPPHAAAPSPSLPPRAAAAAAAPRAVPRLRALVGSHGANLAHALWAGRPCALIEVGPPPRRPWLGLGSVTLILILTLTRWCRRPPALPSTTT